MRSLLIAATALTLVTSSQPARGEDARAASEELIARGVDARLHELHEEGLELFRRAHALSPSARTFAQMGLAELSLRRWLEAEAHLTTALERHDIAWAEDPTVRSVLEKALEKGRAHIGTLLITGTSGAEIAMDGHPVGTLPLAAPIRLEEGKARVVATAAGHSAIEKEVVVTGGQTITARLDLGPPLAVPSAPLPATSPSIQDIAPEPDKAPSSWRTWTGAGLLVVSAAAVAAGAVLLKIDGDGSCSAAAGFDCTQVRDTKAWGWVALGGAAAGAAAGITLIAWRPDGTSGISSMAPTGIGIAGRF